MDHGKVLALDSPRTLKRSIDADTVVRVSSEGDLHALAERLAQMPGATHADAGDGVVRVYLRGVTGALPRVVDATEAAGFRVNDLSVAEPTLESVFITLTGRDLRE